MVEIEGMPYRDIDGGNLHSTITTTGSLRSQHLRDRYPYLPAGNSQLKALPPPRNEAWMKDTVEPCLFVRIRTSGAITYYFRQNARKATLPWEADEEARREFIGSVEDLTLEEARQKVALMKRDAGLKFPYPKRQHRNTRVGEIFEEFEALHPSAHSDAFRDRNNLLTSHLLPRYRDHFLSGMSPTDWECVVDAVAYSNPSRATRLVKGLKSFLSWTIRAGYLRANPLARAKYDEIVPRTRYALSLAEIHEVALASARMEPPWNTIFGLMVYTGVAAEEARGIQQTDIDRWASIWRVNSTANRRLGSAIERRIYLTKTTGAMLEPYIHCTGYLFPSPRSLWSYPLNLSTERLEQLKQFSNLGRDWNLRDLRRGVIRELKSHEPSREQLIFWEIRLEEMGTRSSEEVDVVL